MIDGGGGLAGGPGRAGGPPWPAGGAGLGGGAEAAVAATAGAALLAVASGCRQIEIERERYCNRKPCEVLQPEQTSSCLIDQSIYRKYVQPVGREH